MTNDEIPNADTPDTRVYSFRPDVARTDISVTTGCRSIVNRMTPLRFALSSFEDLDEDDDDPVTRADGRASLLLSPSCRQCNPAPYRDFHTLAKRQRDRRHYAPRFYRYLGRCLPAVSRRRALYHRTRSVNELLVSPVLRRWRFCFIEWKSSGNH